MNPLLTATDLVHWADRRQAQETLPLLVRRLVLATVNPLAIDFASGDSINRPGYDGFLQTMDGELLVPAGQSVWEMGTNRAVSQKANEDYDLRKATPGSVVPAETTFVFVTPRRWQGKSNWADAKRAEHFWRDVHVIDAVDLEQWLDRCPAVATWARRQIVAAPEGLRDLDEVWEHWATRTEPALVPELFTTGRVAQVDLLRAWFSGPPSRLRIRADTVDEAVGFIAAVAQLLNEEAQRQRVLSRGLVVTTPETWRAVAGQNTPVFLIATSPFGAEAQAVARGHHVALVYGTDSAGVPVDIELPHLRRADLEAVLDLMKLSHDRGRDVAAESRGRIAAVVDLLGGATSPPHWATPPFAPQLIPFFLAGSWCQNPGDVGAITSLARASGDDVSQRLSRWANEADPPLRLVGGMWEWVSRQRAWPHLARHITAVDLTAFESVTMEVLGEVDPRLGLPSDRRWMASLYNSAPQFSEALRKGLAETLAMMASQPEQVHAGTDVANLVSGIVRNLFTGPPEPQRWYSLAPVLPLLVEAAPRVLLHELERGPVNDDGVRSILFQEEGYFGGNRACHLLWMLEKLAWSQEHFADAAMVLAGLTAKAPIGRSGNRPDASLRTIFLPWCRTTSASVEQRIAAIDAVNRRYPDVAFRLCLRLLPSRHDSSIPTPTPRWRSWAANRDVGVPTNEYAEYVLALFERALNWAGNDQNRWAQLLHPIPELDRERLDELLSRVEALPLDQFARSTDDRLRRSIRRILHEKLTVEGIHPEISEDLRFRLDRIYIALESPDLVSRDAWLFDTHPELLSVSGNDWRAEDDSRERLRRDVVSGLVGSQKHAELLRLADFSQEAGAVGYHIGQSELGDETLASLLTDCLGATAEKRAHCGNGIIWGRFRRDGWVWVERFFAIEPVRSWSSHQKAIFACALPFETATWDWVEAWGEVAAEEYWRVKVAWVSDAHRDAPRAIQTLLDRKRPFAALHVTRLCMHGEKDRRAITGELQLAVLRGITAVASGNVQTTEGLKLDQAIGHELSELLSAVESAGVSTEQELAQIEWVWLSALENTERGPAILQRLLASDPRLFAQVVGFMFRPTKTLPEGESLSEPDELARNRATQAFKLLHEWRGIPGRGESGIIDRTTLHAWIVTARITFQDSGYADIGDQKIGEILARVPPGDDGKWPHESIRELLEEFRSESMEEGIILGIRNGRGVTVRSPHDGGELEIALARRYAESADSLVRFPRIANVLRQLAECYRNDARREDVRRDLNEFHR
jgi:hypothetical protein